MGNNIIIDKLKLKRFFEFNGSLKEAFNKVCGFMGDYNDADSHKLAEGEPILVHFIQEEKDGYFMAIGRWTAQYPNPIIIPLNPIKTIREIIDEHGQPSTSMDWNIDPTNLDSIYFDAVAKYFKDPAKFDNLIDQYLRGKLIHGAGKYNIVLTDEGDLAFLKADETGAVNIDEVLINRGSKTYTLPSEYIDPDTGELVHKDSAQTQDEFNYFIYNILSWQNYN